MLLKSRYWSSSSETDRVFWGRSEAILHIVVGQIRVFAHSLAKVNRVAGVCNRAILLLLHCYVVSTEATDVRRLRLSRRSHVCTQELLCLSRELCC